MATSTINYTGPTTITCGLDSTPLASSTSFVLGRESTQIDNTTNKYIDALLEGFISTGTTPTVDKSIRIYVWGSHTSLGTTAKDTLDGTDSDETLTSEEQRNAMLVLAKIIRVNATSNVKYNFGPISIAGLFDEMPQFWGVFVTHDTAVALNTTASNHEFKYTGIKFDSA